MRCSQYFFPTLKEIPKDVEINSHQLLLRAGFMRQVSSGLYTMLPLGLRVTQKIEQIVREEMNASGALEISMPVSIPADLWQKSGRWDLYGKELCRFQDRLERWYCLGPTHEEVVTQLVADEVVTYKQLPLNLYQIQTKFRDEIRPRYGLMRAREFVMKDAYSFHTSEEELQVTFESMRQAYQRIFNRCDLDTKAVQADSGNIGGNHSVEFMVLSEVGENELVTCDACDYLANSEVATAKVQHLSTEAPQQSLESFSTPGQTRIEDLVSSLNIAAEDILKARLFIHHETGALLMLLLPGNRQVNLVALAKHFDLSVWREAEAKDLLDFPQLPLGYIGPIGLPESCQLIVDSQVDPKKSYIVGANKSQAHLKNFYVSRDLQSFQTLAFSTVVEGDACPHCQQGKLNLSLATELGHIFNLGDKYSLAMKAQVMDDTGRLKTLLMGCYGIGIGRTLSAVAEQFADDKGLKWPASISPFDLHMITVSIKDEQQMQVSEKLYQALQDRLQLSVLWDERKESPGRKFADADLLGIPLQVIVGKSFQSEGLLELKYRSGGSQKLSFDDLISKVSEIF